MATNLAAVLPEAKGQLTYEKRAIPEPGEGQLLVRNHAIAGNPVDWKIQAYGIFIEKYPIVLGSDIAGVVEKVGPGVTAFAPGDRVSGFAGVVYANKLEEGAFQTYTLQNQVGATKLPADLAFDRAAVLPMGMATAGVGLFVELGLPRTPTTDKSAILVWSAASSVGSCAVQIAHNLGYTVVATASPKNHAWLTKLGADHLFDYQDPDVTKKIAEAINAAGVPLRGAIDAISEDASTDLVAEAIKGTHPTKDVTVVRVLPRDENKPKPEGITVVGTSAMRHARDQKEFGAWFFNEWLAEKLKSGAVVPAPEPEIVDGGIEATGKLFALLQKGVSGKKLVLQVK